MVHGLTPTWCQLAVLASKKTRFDIRQCGICNTPVGYVVKNVYIGYDGNCECTSNYNPFTSRPWSDVHAFLNRHPDKAPDFGINVDDPDWKLKIANYFNVGLSVLEAYSDDGLFLTHLGDTNERN